ncbi:MAG: SDR family oxidoreductase [Chloroflexi bacterium]|nr:SDR family oxidoreductase [Chloroflexota bacterium]
MDTGLRGKTALITGGGTGIGRAIALALAQEGVDVAFASSRQHPETLRQLSESGVRAFYLQADLSREEQVNAMVAQAIDRLGHIDMYINNAATTRHQPITKITSEAWLATLHTNLSACIYACREVARHMIARQQGCILIVGSTAQYTQAYREAAYHITKTGLRVFKNTLALELAPFGIRVNLLVPGHYPTPLTSGASEHVVEIMKTQIPLRRLGQTEEIAPAALLLLSDKLSPYTTGAELTVDGGLHLRPLPLLSDDELRALNQE